MMRIIVGAITGVFIALYSMYFIYPLLSTTHTNFNILVNATDPVISNSYNLGQGFYLVIPWLPLIVAGFVITNVALRRDAGD